MIARFSTTIFLLLTPLYSYAFFCPNNFNQIDFGFSEDQVMSACGSPSSTQSEVEPVPVPQEWNYYMQQPSTNYMGTVTGPYNTQMNNQSGTIKTQITFDANGKVININVNGVTAGNTGMCTPPIQLGDDMAKVKSACGSPAIVSKPNADSNQPGKKMDTFVYTGNQTVKLIFEDGKLVRKE